MLFLPKNGQKQAFVQAPTLQDERRNLRRGARRRCVPAAAPPIFPPLTPTRPICLSPRWSRSHACPPPATLCGAGRIIQFLWEVAPRRHSGCERSMVARGAGGVKSATMVQRRAMFPQHVSIRGGPGHGRGMGPTGGMFPLRCTTAAAAPVVLPVLLAAVLSQRTDAVPRRAHAAHTPASRAGTVVWKEEGWASRPSSQVTPAPRSKPLGSPRHVDPGCDYSRADAAYHPSLSSLTPVCSR